jgi:hypothetical protein
MSPKSRSKLISKVHQKVNENKNVINLLKTTVSSELIEKL